MIQNDLDFYKEVSTLSKLLYKNLYSEDQFLKKWENITKKL